MNWSNEWNVTPQQLEADLEWHTVKHIALSIVINAGEWPTTFDAVQVGDLAVHDQLKRTDGKRHQITHVPTLTRFNAVPDGLWTKVQLIEWCKRVQMKLPEQWAELRSLTPDAYKCKDDARVAICSMCENTEVE